MTRNLDTVLLFVSLFSLAVAKYVDKRLLFNIADGVAVGDVDNSHVDEASGLCASRQHPGILYTHNDHGGHARLYAIDATTAKVVAILNVHGAHNNDWEDVACGVCQGHPDDFCVYIGDTGNGGDGSEMTIYRIQEPAQLTPDMTVNLDSTLKFTWGEVDCETLMVDPTGELFVISKVDGGRGLIAQVPSSGWGTGHRVPVVQSNSHLDVHTTHKGPVGGDISPDGKEVLIKLREQIVHFNMSGSSNYVSVLAGPHTDTDPYISEKRGESVAFSADGQSYFTLGEGHHPTLYRYDAV